MNNIRLIDYVNAGFTITVNEYLLMHYLGYFDYPATIIFKRNDDINRVKRIMGTPQELETELKEEVLRLRVDGIDVDEHSIEVILPHDIISIYR